MDCALKKWCCRSQHNNYFTVIVWSWGQTQWPRGLPRRSAAARLLRLWVLIPPGAWITCCVVYCQVEVSVTSSSLLQRSPNDCGA